MVISPIRNRLAEILGIISIFWIIASFAVWLLPSGNAYSPLQVSQIKSRAILKNISYFVVRYENEHHGNRPQELADLLQFSDEYDEMFYGRSKSEAGRPSDWLTNKATVDGYSDYALRRGSKTGVLVFEKPGLWPDATVGVCFVDGTAQGPVRRISLREFAALGIYKRP